MNHVLNSILAFGFRIMVVRLISSYWAKALIGCAFYCPVLKGGAIKSKANTKGFSPILPDKSDFEIRISDFLKKHQF
jgi:hypothetical protein